MTVREDGSMIESIEEMVDAESVTSPTPQLKAPVSPAQPAGAFGGL